MIHRTALIVLFLFPVSSRADITPSHAAAGGLMVGSIVKLSGGSQAQAWSGFALGAVLGALPDLAGVSGGSQSGNFATYRLWHDFSHPMSIIPPVGLHLLTDLAFHDPMGGGWKPGMIPLVVGIVIVEAILVYLFAQWVSE